MYVHHSNLEVNALHNAIGTYNIMNYEHYIANKIFYIKK